MIGSAAPAIEPLGPTGDVVLHVLAHVPIPEAAPVVTRAATLHDPRYVAWAGATLPPAAIALLAVDGPLLGELLARSTDAVRLQHLVVAFDDAEGLGAALVRPASELLLASAMPAAAEPLWEIAWAAIGLAWKSYRDAWRALLAREVERGVLELEAALQGASRAIPVVACERVRVAHPIGGRARCFDDGLVVGMPGGWSQLEASAIAARVLHETVVRRASGLVTITRPNATAAEHWSLTEGLALAAATTRLRGHPLAGAHAAFLRGLDLRDVAPPEPRLLEALCGALEG